jgi:hypothetical protein
MPIPGTVPVTGIIAPTSTADTYPVTDPQYGLGGLRTVPTINDRDALPTDRRQVGMLVYVTETAKHYILLNGIANTDWTELQSIVSDSLIDGGNF